MQNKTSHRGRGFKASVWGLVLILISATLVVSISNRSVSAAGASTLYFDPASDTVNAGSNFTIDARIDPGTNAVSAVEMHITYNKTKLSLTGVACSSSFSTELTINANDIPSPEDGTARIDCSVGSDPSITTDSAVATFSFHALTANVTNSSVSFTAESVAAADGEPGDVLIARNGSLITITGGTNPVAPSDNGSHKKKKKTPKRYIYQSKKSIAQGATLTQRGKRFSKNSVVMLYFSKFGGGYYSPVAIRTSSKGSFMIKYVVKKPKGTYYWYAIDTKTGKKSKVKTYRVK